MVVAAIEMAGGGTTAARGGEKLRVCDGFDEGGFLWAKGEALSESRRCLRASCGDLKNLDQPLCVNGVLVINDKPNCETNTSYCYTMLSLSLDIKIKRGMYSTLYSYLLLHSSDPKYRMNSTKRLT